MDMRAAIREAAEAAESAPGDLRESAFRTVLGHLLQAGSAESSDGNENGSHAKAQAEPPAASDSAALPVWQAEVVENLPEAHEVVDGTRAQQAVWAVVTLHARGVAVTSDEISRIIRTELGVPPQNAPNTARTLRNLTPRYIMRRERSDGTGYVYSPTARCLEAFEGLT